MPERLCQNCRGTILNGTLKNNPHEIYCTNCKPFENEQPREKSNPEPSKEAGIPKTNASAKTKKRSA